MSAAEREAWADSLAAKLPPFIDSEARAVGLLAAAIDRRVAELLAAAPPLTDEQRAVAVSVLATAKTLPTKPPKRETGDLSREQ